VVSAAAWQASSDATCNVLGLAKALELGRDFFVPLMGEA